MIFFILTLALFLRLIALDQSFWLDEAINVVNAKNLDFLSFVSRYPVGDFHPPGYFALIWIWGHLFDFSEVSIRLPSVLLGVATVWLVYLLGKYIFNHKVGLIAALLLAIGPLHVYYSQEARMYSLATFSGTLSFYFLVRLSDSKKWMVFYILSLCLVLYSDYLTYLILPAQLLYILLCKKSKTKIIFSSMFVSFLSLIPWIPIFYQQFSTGREAASTLSGWSKVVGGANIKELGLMFIKTVIGRVSIYNKFLYGLIAICLSLIYGLILIKSVKKFDNNTKLLICWILIPLLLAFTISFYLPVFSYFRIIFILPGFYLLLAFGLTSLSKRMFLVGLLTITLVSLVSLVSYYLNPSFQRENWKEAVPQIDKLASQDGVILFEDSNLPAPFIYYSSNKSPASAGLERVPASNLNDVKHFLNKDNIYLFEYLVEITDPKRLLPKKIENSGYRLKEKLNFSGVGFVHWYTKVY